MELQKKDKIEFDTSTGSKVIELYYGDITSMPSNPRADILMVSAYHGDYIPTKTSLIGALKRNLSVSVAKLAANKEEDLRKLFHCWWSNPLPDHLAFRRILCFESGTSHLLPEKAVQAIFKALVPACGLFSEGIIVSPLLNTGNQRYDETTMLKAIVSNAVVWMKNGLSVQQFKLVIYRGNDEILETFRLLKREHNRLPGAMMRFKSIRPSVPKFDFYLSYVSEDSSDAERVQNMFLEHKSDLKFFMAENRGDSPQEQLTQEQLFDIMKTCKRVVAFLSPSYLADGDRVEEYNTAWCLNRKPDSTTRLAPMLCQDIAGLPTYMSLIQWVDIRLQNGQTERLVRNITLYVVGYIQEFSSDISAETASHAVFVRPAKSRTKAKEDDVGENEKKAYDVFVSYAHADEEVCKLLVEELQRKIPAVKIFIDREELRTGGSWQQKLYHALESSRMTIALISPAYLNSRMCDEEFRLSIARHFTDKRYHLLPVRIEEMDMDALPDRYSALHNSVLGNQDRYTHITEYFVPLVRDYLQEGKCDGLCFSLNKTTYNLARLLEDGRCTKLSKIIESEPVFNPQKMPESVRIQILSSKDDYDLQIAKEIKRCFLDQFGSMKVRDYKEFRVELSADYDTATNVKKLDEATLIVVLVSASLLQDSDLIEELQVAINRQRYGDCTRLYPVLLGSSLGISLKHYHVYCELLLYEVCLTDPIWMNVNVDQTMESHDNYKETMVKCAKLQQEFEDEHTEAYLQEEDDPALQLARTEKDASLKRLKFYATVCNRIAHHLTQAEEVKSMVLIDTFAVIKEVVLDNESTEKQQVAALESIAKSYTAPPQPQDTKENGNQSRGEKNIESLKSRYAKGEKPTASHSCALL
ncbi:uncharacterized protein [Watersipora subatra]|uniref:uncharacterized protein n=1 Tax=Watersipora subatra TaxID=2589382 RepID=UPI00355B2A45